MLALDVAPALGYIDLSGKVFCRDCQINGCGAFDGSSQKSLHESGGFSVFKLS